MNKKNLDQQFEELLRNDRVGKPDRAIEERLMYTFMVINSRSKLKQNSFASFFGWIFSAQGLGLKAGMISVVLFFSIVNTNLSSYSGMGGGSDSLISKHILVADTTTFIPSVDSLRKDSLN
jgi:hypothetical protein